jgi:hypothetical protein
MENQLTFEILPQPDSTTCGPTCLHAVYRFYSDLIPLEQVIHETGRLSEGGTLSVFLGCHALKRGYHARLYTFNLNVFDPTWFRGHHPPLKERLLLQRAVKQHMGPKFLTATDAYVEFLELGGEIRMEVLNGALIRKYLKKGRPLLTGLSSTFLYGEPRERNPDVPLPGGMWIPDDIAGEPQGHFVVLCGYDSPSGHVLVADPLWPNPMADNHIYSVGLDRVACAILLGIVTYDANLLILSPGKH